jgi:hypothetical protein
MLSVAIQKKMGKLICLLAFSLETVSIAETSNSKKNDSYRRLIDLIASGDSVLMVGAGSSKIVGYALWGELIGDIEKEAENISADTGRPFRVRPLDDTEDDLAYASRLKQFIGDSIYFALIHRLFDDGKGCDDCHVDLLKLPFRGVITTNYDHLLENALFKATGIPPNDLVIDENH